MFCGKLKGSCSFSLKQKRMFPGFPGILKKDEKKLMKITPDIIEALNKATRYYGNVSQLAKNMGDKVLEYMSDRYYIVGRCESDYYLALGMALSFGKISGKWSYAVY